MPGTKVIGVAVDLVLGLEAFGLCPVDVGLDAGLALGYELGVPQRQGPKDHEASASQEGLRPVTYFKCNLKHNLRNLGDLKGELN